MNKTKQLWILLAMCLTPMVTIAANYKAALSMGAAASWSAAHGADHGIYWNTDGHPYAHYSSGGEALLDHPTVFSIVDLAVKECGRAPELDDILDTNSTPCSVVSNTNDRTVGAGYFADTDWTSQGMDFYWRVNAAATITCKLWANVHAGFTLIATATQSVTTSGKNTCTWSAPQSLIAGRLYAFSIYDGGTDDGGFFSLGSTNAPSGAGIVGSITNSPYSLGNHLWGYGFGMFVNGSGAPTSAAANRGTTTFPVYTVP